MHDQPREGEIILYEWLYKRDWKERFAPFGVIPGEAQEPVALHTPAEHPKPRVLDLVRVQTPTRDGFEIRYNARVRKEFQYRMGAALAFCPTKDDAEETRHRLYAAYLQGGTSPLLAGYRRLF